MVVTAAFGYAVAAWYLKRNLTGVEPVATVVGTQVVAALVLLPLGLTHIPAGEPDLRRDRADLHRGDLKLLPVVGAQSQRGAGPGAHLPGLDDLPERKGARRLSISLPDPYIGDEAGLPDTLASVQRNFDFLARLVIDTGGDATTGQPRDIGLRFGSQSVTSLRSGCPRPDHLLLARDRLAHQLAKCARPIASPADPKLAVLRPARVLVSQNLEQAR
jgi:hypothetical protein